MVIAQRRAAASLILASALAGGPGHAADPAAPAPAASNPPFDVSEYRVVGNTVLAGRDIERVLYPLLGAAKTLADVEAARAALEALYHDKGYGTVFVDIPPQTVTGGLVRLRVTEGRVEREQISGARFFPERDVLAALPAAQPGQVLRLSDLQQQLTALNSATPDRSVVPVLKAGSVPGTVDLALQVNDSLPVHGSLELNNQASLDTHVLRSVASVSYGNLFGALDSLSLQYQGTPQDLAQVRVFAANYQWHALESGLQPSMQYVNSNSNVAVIGTLGVLGIGEITSLHLGYPFRTEAGSQQSVTVGVDYKHFRNLINENSTTRSADTPITYLNLSFAYAGLWRTDPLTTTLSLGANLGPRGIVNNQTGFANDRALARDNYFYLRGDLALNFRLPADFGLRLRAAGQGAAEPLITNENYAIAGIDGVRGYLESEVLGDQALKESAQLTSPAWRDHDHSIADAFLFFDAGRTWIRDSLDAIDPRNAPHCEPSGTGLHLRSWGTGVDLFPGQKITGSFTWARALDDATDLPAVFQQGGCAASGPATRAGQNRWLFLLRGSF